MKTIIVFLLLTAIMLGVKLYRLIDVTHITKGPVSENVAALTFDDGPNPPFTDAILRILKKHAVHATFFVIGENVIAYPGALEKICVDGHEIGNHGFFHAHFTFASPSSIRKEIELTDWLVQKSCPTSKALLFRSPFADHSVFLSLALKSLHRKNILYSVEPAPPDYLRPSPYQIAESIMAQIHPGAIIALHDGEATQAETVLATDLVVSALKERGYRLVTVSELLKMPRFL